MSLTKGENTLSNVRDSKTEKRDRYEDDDGDDKFGII